MSSRAQSPFSLTAYPYQDTAFAWELLDSRCGPSVAYPALHMVTPTEGLSNYNRSSNVPIQAPTANFRQSCVQEQSFQEPTPFLSHANQVYTDSATAPFPTTHLNHWQHNFPPWRSTDMQMVLESSPTSYLRTAVKSHVGGATSAPSPRSAYYDRDLHVSGCAAHAAIVPCPSWALQHNSLDHLSSGYRRLGEPGTHQFLSHATYSHFPQNVTNSFYPPHLPLHQSFSQSSPYWSLRPTPTGYLEPNPCFRFVPPRDSTHSHRHGRGARAIEYGGSWIDEEELVQSSTELNGKLNVHQCLWEEDRSPCHLWVKSDKSCIHTHIQKWHGGKPGGDKLEVECRWPACGQSMLKESVARHILSIHLGKRWRCRGCGKGSARKDAHGRHVAQSDLERCRTEVALVTYSAEVRVIDARAALDSGGRLRFADA